MSSSLQSMIEPLISLCRSTSMRIAEIYNGKYQIDQKSDMTPVTCADLAAHCSIMAGLDLIAPGVPVLSEEADEIPFAQRSKWHTYWLVDPVDGTREFINGTGEFTINIALIDNYRPILGIIYAPIIEVCYYATQGGGAYKLLPNCATRKVLHTRPCNKAEIVVVAGRSGPSPQFTDYVRQIPYCHTMTIGSSLKSCLVAEGCADIYPRFGPTSEWDTAAAQCIVEEAGGMIADTAMQPLRYNTKASLLNPNFFAVGDVRHPWRHYLPPAIEINIS